MNRKLILAVAGAAATVLAVAPADAQGGRWANHGWRTVAYTRVDGRDMDTIWLRGNIRERSIRLCAINQALNLRDFDIRYRNGGHQDVNTRAVLRAGTCTRAVDLRGNRRDIASIRLKYAPIWRAAMRPMVRVQVR